MEPLMGAGAPPVPHGRAAAEAWRDLDRQTRRRLLDGTERNPDPTTAVIAVGYARAWLSGVQRRAVLMRLGLFAAIVVVDIVMAFSLGVPAQATAIFIPVTAVCILLITRPLTARRIVRMTRMETDLASRLWQSELPDPALFGGPFSAPTGPSEPVAVRYSRKSLARFYGLAFGFVALVTALLWAQGNLLAIPLTALMLLGLGMSVYANVRFVRPWLPAMTMDADGVTLTVQGISVPWNQIPEIRVMPVKGGGLMVAKRSVVVFMVAHPEALLGQLASRPLRMARRAQAAYGSPLVIADVALDRTAEHIARAAKTFTTAPIRRFSG